LVTGASVAMRETTNLLINRMKKWIKNIIYFYQ
jgi:hypothetical protein